ncbi:Dolichyl-diphosphooligosaccharide--protein glycosyltransferase subunit wbp1 [Neolecta irregularis DAH-3]|uniref:Dolichyl-diphosphooligosaccharide--protein glycosyltransferase subunit WBP1 n=1 Tax=Neolecta irregularis (strain DAH-3) TaxID=1198029 RepID=A0A1U7LNX7_NEOID|nr:Dolichyl-diphosphooligosaccharide--protein glycosyltransferase subunit wbp1 [Neolecta irregularis DAH-3]|eukprot:OLL24339.1 Dolichyl-diphosphooligosaccharide--protein glycosyltransferase subunit wbp1 [Neolecta irregularis DAH-3]
MIMLHMSISLFLFFAAFASAHSVSGNRLLVVHDVGVSPKEYSTLFGFLKDRLFDITFKDIKADTSLFQFDERLYDHLVIMTTKSKGLGPNLTARKVLDHVKSGGNLLFAGSPSVPETLREISRELDIEFAQRDSLVVDHFSPDPKHPTFNTFSSNQNILSEAVRSGNSVKYSGIGMSLGESSMLVPFLRASRTAYSYDTKEEFSGVEDSWMAGTQMVLATGFQARNNARVGVTGSLEMFSNEYVNDKTTGNENFIQEFTKWVFQETGVIRFDSGIHHLAGQVGNATAYNPKVYKVKTDMTYTAKLSHWNGKSWVPYNPTDVQLEIKMLDPYIRQTLPSSLTTTLTLPDQYGVFTFQIIYERPGLSNINHKELVTIRHLRTDEYPRFLIAAWPYYTSSAVVVMSWLLFCGIWLYFSDGTSQEINGKKSKTKKNE